MALTTPLRIVLEPKFHREGEEYPFQLKILDGTEDTVESALKKLAGYKILSAPVKLSNGKFLLIDLLTIANALSTGNAEDVLKLPVGKICGRMSKPELIFSGFGRKYEFGT